MREIKKGKLTAFSRHGDIPVAEPLEIGIGAEVEARCALQALVLDRLRDLDELGSLDDGREGEEGVSAQEGEDARDVMHCVFLWWWWWWWW